MYCATDGWLQKPAHPLAEQSAAIGHGNPQAWGVMLVTSGGIAMHQRDMKGFLFADDPPLNASWATCRFVQTSRKALHNPAAKLDVKVEPPPPPLPGSLLSSSGGTALKGLHLQSNSYYESGHDGTPGRTRNLQLSAHIPAPGGAGALGPARNGMLLRVVAAQSLSGGREELSSPTTRSSTPDGRDRSF